MTAMTPIRDFGARRKMQAITPLLKFRHEGQHLSPDGHAFSRMTDLVEHVASHTGVSGRTLWRWYARFLSLGNDGLQKRTRSDKGTSRYFEKHLWADAFVRQHCSSFSIKSIYRELQKNVSGGPSLETVRCHVRSVGKVRQ